MAMHHTHYVSHKSTTTSYEDSFLATPPEGVDALEWARSEVARRRPGHEWTVTISSHEEIRKARAAAKATT